MCPMPVEEVKGNATASSIDDPHNRKITIEFTLPEAYRSESQIFVEVLGNFTHWCPEAMAKSPENENVFVYEVTLKRGFKYR